MDCGHGGVCYECAIENWKKSNNCVICRSEVKMIYEVELVKGTHVSKVAKYITKNVEY